VGVLVGVLQVLLVHVRVLVGHAVVAVLVLMLDVRVIVRSVGVHMRRVAVAVLVGVRGLGHRRSFVSGPLRLLPNSEESTVTGQTQTAGKS
jgi:hypothetical protein